MKIIICISYYLKKMLNIKIIIDIDCVYGVWMNLLLCLELMSDSEWYV